MKNIWKLLLMILIFPLIITNVNAKEITLEEYGNIFIQNTTKEIYLNNTFAYYIDNSNKREEELSKKAEEILNNMNIQMKNEGLEYATNNVSVYYTRQNQDYTIFSCNLVIDDVLIKTEYVDIRYKDFENFNSEDSKIIDSLFVSSSIHNRYEIPFNEAFILQDSTVLLKKYPLCTEIEEIIESTGITYKTSNISIDNSNLLETEINVEVHLFKNDVYYKTIYISNYYIAQINTPDYVEKTIESYENYANKEVSEYLGKEDIKLVQTTPDLAGYANYYCIYENEQYTGIKVSIVNNNKVLLSDFLEVDLDTSQAAVFAKVITEENKKITNYLNSTGYTNILRSYYLYGNDMKNINLLFDRSLNGKTVKVLLTNKEDEYIEFYSVIENEKITINICMIGELYIALKSEEDIKIEDLIKNVSGYYSSSYQENEEKAIKDEIEKVIKEEIKSSVIDYEEKGYIVSLEKENIWYIRLTDKNGKIYKINVFITPKKINIDSNNSQKEIESVILKKITNDNYQKEELENELAEQSKTDTKNESLANTSKDNKKDLEEKKNTTVNQTRKIPIRIIIGSIIALIIGGGIYRIRSRYY